MCGVTMRTLRVSINAMEQQYVLNIVIARLYSLVEEACHTDTTPTQPHRNSNTHRNKNTQPMW